MINVDKRKGSTLMNTETYEYLITIEELFEMLSIGKNTTYRLLKTNQIKAFKIGRIWKIPRDAVSQYVISQSRK